MWRNVGIERDGQALVETPRDHRVLGAIRHGQGLRRPETAVAGWEIQNMLTVCAMIATAAMTRTDRAGATIARLPTPDDAHCECTCCGKAD